MKTSARVRFLWMLIALLFAWQLFRIPAIATSFWTFCATGVVPVIHKTLSPESVGKLLIGAFVVSFMLIFRQEIIASFPQRKQRPQALTQRITQPKASKPLLIVKPMNKPALLASSITRMQVIMQALRLLLVKLVRHMHAYILGGMAVLVARLRPLASALANGAQYASKQLLVFIRKTVVVCIVLAIVTWQATEPYIRRFDRLLEAMLRRNATTASMLAFGEDSLKAAKDVYHKVDTYARKVLQLS